MKGKINQKQRSRNVATLKAYHSILRSAKRLLSTIEDEPLRYTLTRLESHRITRETILHEWVTPLLYLRLDLTRHNEYEIHYGYLVSPTFGGQEHITSSFLRMIYKRTMRSSTPINIEAAVRNDYVITECAEAYEYIEMQQKHHRFKLLPYKVKAEKRKLRIVA